MHQLQFGFFSFKRYTWLHNYVLLLVRRKWAERFFLIIRNSKRFFLNRPYPHPPFLVHEIKALEPRVMYSGARKRQPCLSDNETLLCFWRFLLFSSVGGEAEHTVAVRVPGTYPRKKKVPALHTRTLITNHVLFLSLVSHVVNPSMPVTRSSTYIFWSLEYDMTCLVVGFLTLSMFFCKEEIEL